MDNKTTPRPPLDWRDLKAKPFDLEDLAELLAAANDVVNDWDSRSLVHAVNRLREALEELGAREEEKHYEDDEYDDDYDDDDDDET